MKTKKKHLRSDLLPVILMTGVLPLVVKGQKVGVTLGKYSWFPDGSFQYDFFIYWKSILFLLLVGWMVVMYTFTGIWWTDSAIHCPVCG